MKLLTLLISLLLFGEPNATTAETPERTNDPVLYAGQDAELALYSVTGRTIEVVLSPLDADGIPVPLPESGVLIDHEHIELWRGRSISEPVELSMGNHTVQISSSPLSVALLDANGSVVQSVSWPDDPSGTMEFTTDAPVYGLGEGGAQEGFDRRGHIHSLRDGNVAYERSTHGAYVAVPMLSGADGWSLFIHHPIHRGNQFDLREGAGRFIPDEEAMSDPVRLYLTAWESPSQIFSEYRAYAGETPLPPLWALGYMQSHRTLTGPDEIRWVAETLRERNHPADAVIYLGTGFTPTGWNMGHDSFEFNPRVFDDPEAMVAELHDLHYKVILHNYNPPRGLHGASLEEASESSSHIRNYWDRHRAPFSMGIDGWWPDGGENLPSESRVTRHRMYYTGSLADRPGVRPWSLHRTGYSGVHRYGGWIWSGDPDSRWETLQTHIKVGLNHSMSISPWWGSDIAGFVPTHEFTGDLYLRWLQFSAFTPSFRAHGRTWHLRLPWGWNRGHIGPPENSIFEREGSYPYPEELRNALIEPIVREYLQLRYRLLSYNYGLAREAHETGMPLMRPVWLHHSDDPVAPGLGNQYLWGRDLMVAPVYERHATERALYLPEGLWYDFWTGEPVDGGREIVRQVDLATLPLYVRAGAILPLDPVRQYTSQEVDEPVVFQIYAGADGSMTWYRDDGESLDYQDGGYSKTRIQWSDESRELTIEPHPESDGLAPEPAPISLKLISAEAADEMMNWSGDESGEQLELRYFDVAEKTLQVMWDGSRLVVPFPKE
ncbi:MAG: TIM-barrel domain-containing protein [Balneolaceae bacterium]